MVNTNIHAPNSMDAKRRSAPAVARNREPILDVLRRFFPEQGRVIELASGTGEHAVFFGAHFPRLTWQPSDVDPNNLESIAAWRETSEHGNVLAPMQLDLLREPTPLVHPPAQYDAAFCANLIHIAPWVVCQHLMQFVAAALHTGGRFVMYGPFKLNGQHTAESNVAFEQWLLSQSDEYGVRHFEDVVEQARLNGLVLLERVPMPANNFCLIFEKREAA